MSIQQAYNARVDKALKTLEYCEAAGITKPEGLKELVKIIRQAQLKLMDGVTQEREQWLRESRFIIEEIIKALTACGITEDKEG